LKKFRRVEDVIKQSVQQVLIAFIIYYVQSSYNGSETLRGYRGDFMFIVTLKRDTL
jgi:hypothetical protein